ncbi:MAG: hypothetical protein ACLQIB_27025 [Isosphaeraceae bacterium]
MKNIAFPRWAAPLVGVVAGGLVGGRAARRAGEGFSPAWRVGGAVLGLVAGLFVWLLDKPTTAAEQISEEPQASEGGQVAGVAIESSGSVIARFFALLAILLCCVPVVGLILAGIAWFPNQHVRGWPKTTSRIGTGIALLITGLAVILMIWNPSSR